MSADSMRTALTKANEGLRASPRDEVAIDRDWVHTCHKRHTAMPTSQVVSSVLHSQSVMELTSGNDILRQSEREVGEKVWTAVDHKGHHGLNVVRE